MNRTRRERTTSIFWEESQRGILCNMTQTTRR